MPPRHSEMLAFLRAIKENPEDDAPRLIFADWLEKRGDPRGEFIRLQCALARMDKHGPRRADLARREEELLQQHKKVWLRQLGVDHLHCRFERGLVHVTAYRWNKGLDALMSRLDALVSEETAAWLERLRSELDALTSEETSAWVEGLRVTSAEFVPKSPACRENNSSAERVQ